MADGLFDLSYSPYDVILLNGNYCHGVTGLRDLQGEGSSKRTELERFSCILFNTWERAGGMRKTGNFDATWQDGWALTMPHLTQVPRNELPLAERRERIPKRRFEVDG